MKFVLAGTLEKSSIFNSYKFTKRFKITKSRGNIYNKSIPKKPVYKNNSSKLKQVVNPVFLLRNTFPFLSHVLSDKTCR
jgi:hypothetical protein